MLQFAGTAAAGSCAFADPYQFRAELKWRDTTSAKSPPDLPGMQREYLRWLKSEAAAREVQAEQQGTWRGASGVVHGQPFSSWTRWAAGRLLLELFLWWPGRRDTALETALLGGCGPAEDPALWRALGLEVRTALPLWRCTAQPGYISLEFGADPRKRPFLTVERRGLARHWLGGKLAEWHRARLPPGIRLLSEQMLTHGSAQVHCISGRMTGSPLLELWRRRPGASPPAPDFVDAAYLDPAGNSVFRLQWQDAQLPTDPAASLGQLPAPWQYSPHPAPAMLSPSPDPNPASALAPPTAWHRLLAARPLRNAAVATEPTGRTVVLSVPNRRPRWHRPPLSWFLPWRTHRRIALDALGSEFWQGLEPGTLTIGQLITEFATEHQLTFHESHLTLGRYLQLLLERGLIAMAAPPQEPSGTPEL